VAAFRAGVISDFVNGRQLQWGDVDRLMQEKCTQRWQILGSLRTRISESTIKDWIRRYKNSDKKLESLYPSDRSDCGKTQAIDSKTATSLIALRKEMPAVKLPVLMKEAQKRKIIMPEKTVTYFSLHRLLQAEDLLQKIPIDPQDRLRFEA
jgi:putative transposase